MSDLFNASSSHDVRYRKRFGEEDGARWWDGFSHWLAALSLVCANLFAGCLLPRDGITAEPPGSRTKSERSVSEVAVATAHDGSATVATAAPTEVPSSASGTFPPSDALAIREGDVLKISFPGTPNLDATQQVRLDGRITLGLIGEVVVTGLTPKALEQELIKQYSTQLVSKEVTVTVVSTSFAVYVSGAVLHPGKFSSTRPMTALEAIMEASGFDQAKADSKAVVVIRQEGGQTKRYTLNLKAFLEGKPGEAFYLKSGDIVYVPEKFNWF